MIAIDPNQAVDYTLKIDADKPVKDRPTFVLRFLTARQWIRFIGILERIDALAEQKKNDEALDAGVEAMALLVTGWRNIPGDPPFDVKQLPDVLTDAGFWELLYGGRNAILLTENDRKKSASPSASAAGPSASNAAPAANV